MGHKMPNQPESHSYFFTQDEKIKEIDRKVGALEGQVTTIDKCLGTLTQIQVHLADQVERNRVDIVKIKDRRAELFDKIIGYVLSAVIGGIIVYILSQVGLGQ